MEKVRIQKALAEAGIASRRAIEEMIVEGRISVNGELVNELPFFIDPEHDEVRVDGKPISRRPAGHVYFLLNKPKGVVCTQADPQHRPLAWQLVPDIAGRVYCVGGLDADSTGLVLLTNDGPLNKELTDPRKGVEMSYIVDADGLPDPDDFLRLRQGIFLEGNRTPPIRARIVRRGREQTSLELHTFIGRNQLIRRIFHNLGHKVRKMKRDSFGPIDERGLKIGHFRMLLPRELRLLREGKTQIPRKEE